MTKIPQKIQELIFERAYEIEQLLYKHDFLYAKIVGITPEKIEKVALNIAMREFQCQLKESMQTCEQASSAL